jgi:hypothetical protein
MDHLSRSPLNLLSEVDDKLRELERQATTGDPEAVARFAGAQRRAGVRPDKPDSDHHWRWNGKGWYTRPDWNGGRCPPGSEPTSHGSCLSHQAHQNDRAQYASTKSVADEPVGQDIAGRGQYRHVIGPENDDPDYSDPGDRRFSGKVLRGPANPPDEEGNRVMFHTSPSRHLVKPATGVEWDHPDGPQITSNERGRAPNRGYHRRDPRPLPEDPEHLPRFQRSLGMGPRHSKNLLKRTKEGLVKHYTDRGFDPGYMAKVIRGPQAVDTSHERMTRQVTSRLPPSAEGPMRQRIIRRATKAKDRELASRLGSLFNIAP